MSVLIPLSDSDRGSLSDGLDSIRFDSIRFDSIDAYLIVSYILPCRDFTVAVVLSPRQQGKRRPEHTKHEL